MSDVKISGLPTSAALTGAEIAPIVQVGVTSQVSLATLKVFMNSGGTAGAGVFSSLSSGGPLTITNTATVGTASTAWIGGNGGAGMWINAPSGSLVNVGVNNAAIGTFSSTGLAVTGTLSSTGNTTLGDASTDTVTVNGYMGVGVAPGANTGVFVKPTALTGTGQYSVGGYVVGTSAATTKIVGFGSGQTTAAAAFTVTDSIGFEAANTVKGAGSTITNQHGVYVLDQTQGTNNYGITSLVSSGTNKWNIYASGTAANYFAGNVGINNTGNLERLAVKADAVVGAANVAHFYQSDLTAGSSAAIYLNSSNGALTRSTVIRAITNGGPAGNGHSLAFETSANGTAPTERMRIDYAGNVGVGTSAPSTRLHLKNADDGTDLTIRLDHGDTSLTTDQQIGAVEVYSNDPSGAGVGAKGALRIRSSDATGTSSYLTLSTSSTTVNDVERLRIDSVGNLGVGVTPSAWDTTFKAFQVGPVGGLNLGGASNDSFIGNNTYYNAGWKFSGGAGPATMLRQNNGAFTWYYSATGTGGTAITWSSPMTLDASGNLLVGVTSPAAGQAHVFKSTASSTNTVSVINAHASNPAGQVINYSAAAPNGTINEFLYCVDNAAVRATIRSNGGLANFSANNVNLSDVRTKTNIQDAPNYLERMCAVPVRTFLYKDQTDDIPNLGVIAQEIEQHVPELVDNSGFGETPADGIPLKTIYQTDFQYALLKCIQEQQVMIELLLTRIETLEAAQP